MKNLLFELKIKYKKIEEVNIINNICKSIL